MSQEQLQRTGFTSGLISKKTTGEEKKVERPKIEDVFAEAEALAGTVRCIHGANEQNLPIMGKNVEWVRNNMKDALNIAPGATALIDGEKVNEDHILVEGQTLEFLKESGRKGN